VAQDPAGSVKPAKDKSTERIDGSVALILIMAIGRAMAAQEQPQPLSQAFWVGAEVIQPGERHADRAVVVT
jgi:hypothetical protein